MVDILEGCNTMKSIFLKSILAGLFSLASFSFVNAADLTVTVTGLKQAKGVVRIGVYDEAGYKNGGSNETRPVFGYSVKVDSLTVTHIFKDAPEGIYGIKLCHDQNGNGKLDRNMFGIPRKPYAFSNNAKGNMAPAKWEDARFEMKNEDVMTSIQLD